MGKNNEIENKKFFRKRKIDYTMNVVMFFYLTTLFYSLIFNFPLFAFLFKIIIVGSLILFIIEGKQSHEFNKMYKEREMKNRSTFSKSWEDY